MFHQKWTYNAKHNFQNAIVDSGSVFDMSGSSFSQFVGVMEQERAVRRRAAGDRIHTCNFSVR